MNKLDRNNFFLRAYLDGCSKHLPKVPEPSFVPSVYFGKPPCAPSATSSQKTTVCLARIAALRLLLPTSCGLQACCAPASLALSTCAARGPVTTCLPPAAMMRKHRLTHHWRQDHSTDSTKSANHARKCSRSCRCTTSSSRCSSKPCEETSTSTLHCRYSSTERGRVHFLSSAELLILLEDFCMDPCT